MPKNDEAAQLRALRDELRLTQVEMAQLLGCSRASIAAMETKRRPIQTRGAIRRRLDAMRAAVADPADRLPGSLAAEVYKVYVDIAMGRATAPRKEAPHA